MNTIYSVADRKKFVSQVNKLRKGGKTLQEACDKAGISTASFYSWSNNVAMPSGRTGTKTATTSTRRKAA